MKELTKFAHALFNNCFNERASRAQLNAAHGTWATQQEALESEEAGKLQRYIDTIDIPRQQRFDTYNEYLREKQQLWSEWRDAASAEKMQILQRIIRTRVPASIKEGVDKVSIYTKNIAVL